MLVIGAIFVVLVVALWGAITIKTRDSGAAPRISQIAPAPVTQLPQDPSGTTFEPLTGHADPGTVVYFWNKASGVGPQVLFTIIDPLAVQLDNGDSEMLVEYPDGTTEHKLRRAFTVGTDFYWIKR